MIKFLGGVFLCLFCTSAWAKAPLEKQLDAVLGPGKSNVTVHTRQIPAQHIRKKEYQNPQVLSQVTTLETQGGTTHKRTQTQYLYNEIETLTQHPKTEEKSSVSVVYEGQLSPIEVQEMIQNQLSSNTKVHVQKASFDRSAYLALKAEMDKAKKGQFPWLFLLGGLMGGGLFGAGAVFFILKRRQGKFLPAPSYDYATYVQVEPEPLSL